MRDQSARNFANPRNSRRRGSSLARRKTTFWVTHRKQILRHDGDRSEGEGRPIGSISFRRIPARTNPAAEVTALSTCTKCIQTHPTLLAHARNTRTPRDPLTRTTARDFTAMEFCHVARFLNVRYRRRSCCCTTDSELPFQLFPLQRSF